MVHWQQLLIAPNSQLATAFNKFDATGSDVLIVADAAMRPLGLLTERGTRRALLGGANVDHPITALIEPVVATGDGNARAGDPDGIELKLNAQGQIYGVSNYSDPSLVPSDTLVVLMVGGAGTRLRPLTANCPKPLLPVQGRPLLEITVERLASLGFRRFCMTVGYRAEMICNHFGDGSRWGVEISYVHERERLGTCGALRLLPQRPRSSFIVMNGDVITDINYAKLVSFHQATKGGGTVCAHRYDVSIPYGVLSADGDKLTGAREKPTSWHWISAGIYVLEPELIDLIPPGRPFDMPTLLQVGQANNHLVSIYGLRERWIDIGSIEEYERANSTPGILPASTQDSRSFSVPASTFDSTARFGVKPAEILTGGLE